MKKQCSSLIQCSVALVAVHCSAFHCIVVNCSGLKCPPRYSAVQSSLCGLEQCSSNDKRFTWDGNCCNTLHAVSNAPTTMASKNVGTLRHMRTAGLFVAFLHCSIHTLSRDLHIFPKKTVYILYHIFLELARVTLRCIDDVVAI